MKKDAYYFPHFSNARNDSKLIKLKRVLGIEGYGIYFMLLEVLREQTEFKLSINGIEDLAYEWHTSKEKIIAVIKDFDLFEIDNGMFSSAKLILYLQPYIEKSDRARLAANTRWEKVNANACAKALPEHSKSNASKVKESKVNKIIQIPIFEEFETYALEKEPLIDKVHLKSKYDAWLENGWKNGNDKKIVNWKSALNNTIPYLKKEQPKKEQSKYIFLTLEEIKQKDLNQKRRYIRWNNQQGYHGILNDDELIKNGFQLGQIVNIYNEVL